MRYLVVMAFCLFGVFNINAQDEASSTAQKDTYLKWFINYRVMSTDLDKDGEISQEEIAADKNKFWAFYAIPQNFKFTDKDESETLSSNELKAMRYREEGQSLQTQADDYDKLVEMYSFKSVSNIDWLKENPHVANKIMSNHEWLENNKGKFNAVAKTNWLGVNDNIITDITNNHFLILRRPDLAKMLQVRYPRQMNTFVKAFMQYHNARAMAVKNKPSGSKLNQSELEKAKNAPKRTVK